MNNPKLFSSMQQLTHFEIKKGLDKFSHLIQWRADKKDTWLDIGCGPGENITKNLIPLLPTTFTKIIGADISTEMIEYAQKNYQHSKLSFRLINIEDNDIGKYHSNDNEQFDHISCFFTFHWITNQPLAMKNIYNLLGPNGDCLIILFCENPVFNSYYKLMKYEKWQKYIANVENKLEYYRGAKTTSYDELTKMFKSAGFYNYEMDLSDSEFSVNSIKTVKDALKSVNPFIDRIPDELKNEFMNDLLCEIWPTVDFEKKTNFEFKYTLITAHATKKRSVI